MQLSEYQKLTSRTNTDLGSKAINAAHVTLGIVGEMNELNNEIYYLNEPNAENVFIESGDASWYISELANLFSIELTPCDYYDWADSVGWIAETIKKYLAYNREVDVYELQKRLESILFYIHDNLKDFDFTLEDCLQANITKLQKRFPEKFSAELAIAKGDENINP